MHAQILTGDELGNLTGRITDAVIAVLADLASQVAEPALNDAAQALVVATRDQMIRTPVDPAPMMRAILRRDAVGRPLAADEQDEFGVALSPAIPDVPVAPLPVELDWESDADTASVADTTDEVAKPADTTVEDAPLEDAPLEDAPLEAGPVDEVPVGDSLADATAVDATAVQVAAADDAGAAQVAAAHPSSPAVTPSYWPPAPVVSDTLFAQFTADNRDVVPHGQQNESGQDPAGDFAEASSSDLGTDQAMAGTPAPQSDPSQPGHFYAGPLARWNQYHPPTTTGAVDASPGQTQR